MPTTQAQLKALLVEAHVLDAKTFDELALRAREKELPIPELLTDLGLATDEQLGQLFAHEYAVRFIRLSHERISDEILSLIPESFARTHLLIPVSQTDSQVVIATAQPDDVIMRSLLEKYLRTQVVFAYATPVDLQNHLFLFRRDPKEEFRRIVEAKEQGGPEAAGAIIELVDTMIDSAYQVGSSDIHVEPEDDYTVIRYRTDGVLHDIARLPLSVHQSIITRLKVLGRLATDEHRTAQDGKITHKGPWGDEVEIRLSIVPTTHDEKAVMRLLSDKARRFHLTDLGLSKEDFAKFEEGIERPWGLILVTGPTGSGKTTSLYAALKVLNKREVNITTVEDPVEYDIEGVNQIQVNEKTGLTFAKGLRSIVRQDPDVIMVGEIRDKEAAGIAVNAAMTGHIVLSTLHTNDAATAFPRLVDMDVEDFLIASTVNTVIAQRLVRKVCRRCILSYAMTDAEKGIIEGNAQIQKYLKQITGKEDLTKVRLFKGKGCPVCHHSGYAGRTGVFEVLEVSDAVREAVMARKNADKIHDVALAEGMTTMMHDGLQKVVEGVTTLEEVLRVIMEK